MRSQELQTQLTNLFGENNSPLKDSLILKHLAEIQYSSEAEKEKKKFLFLMKLLADHIAILNKFLPYTPNKTEAQIILTNSEKLFAEAFPSLQRMRKELTEDSLKDENFYKPENLLANPKERSHFSMDSIEIQTAIAKQLAPKNAEGISPQEALIQKISEETKSSDFVFTPEEPYASTKRFLENAGKHFTSYPDPMIQCLQKSLINTLEKATDLKTAEAVQHSIEQIDTSQNATPFIVEAAKQYQSIFALAWGFLKVEDLQKYNAALQAVSKLGIRENGEVAAPGENKTQKAVEALRQNIKGLSTGAKRFTRAPGKLQELFGLILKPYLNASTLTATQLSQLAGIFLELPFSNKHWGLSYAILRMHFPKLDYESKLKVISAALEREVKKKEPSHIVTNLIWQTYASASARYDEAINPPLNECASLKAMNAKHYNFLNNHFIFESKKQNYLSDLPELFDYANGAEKKQDNNPKPETAALQREVEELKASVGEDLNPCKIKCEKIAEEKKRLDSEINNALEFCKGALYPEETRGIDFNTQIENRLSQLEKAYKILKQRENPLNAEKLKILETLIERGKVTLDLEERRLHIKNDPALSEFYSELLRGLTILFSALRAIASGKVERRNVPTVYLSTFFSQLSSLLSMPVVSGVLEFTGEAIKTAGSLKLKFSADAASKVTVTNSQLEYLLEQITLRLTYHLEEGLKNCDLESAKKTARFCQERLIAVILANQAKNDWADPDKTADKYAELLTQKIAPKDSLIEKTKMFFQKLKTLGFSLVKRKDNKEQTIVDLVTEKVFNPEEYHSPKTASDPLPNTEESLPPKGLANAKPTPIQEVLKIYETKIGDINEKENALEEENAQLKREMIKLQAENTQLSKDFASLKQTMEEIKSGLAQDLVQTKQTLLEAQNKNAAMKKTIEEFAEKTEKRSRKEASQAQALRAHLVAPEDEFTTPIKKPASNVQILTETPETKEPPEDLKGAVQKTIESKVRQYHLFTDEDSSEASTDDSIQPKNLLQEFQEEPQTLVNNNNTVDLSHLNVNLKNSVRVLNELLSSEQKLCEYLDSLATNYKQKTDEKERIRKAIGDEKFGQINDRISMVAELSKNPFSNIKKIELSEYKTEKELLEAFEDRLESLLNIIRSPSLIERWIDFFNLSIDFENVRKFVSRESVRELFDSFTYPQPFSAIYIMPAQRIMRYDTLFKEMNSHYSKLTTESPQLDKKMQLGLHYCSMISFICNAFKPKSDYDFKLMMPGARMSHGSIYIECAEDSLKYTVVNPAGNPENFEGLITSKDIEKLKSKPSIIIEAIKKKEERLKELETEILSLEPALSEKSPLQSITIDLKNLRARIQNLIGRCGNLASIPSLSASAEKLKVSLQDLDIELKDNNILKPIAPLFTEILEITTRNTHTPPLNTKASDDPTFFQQLYSGFGFGVFHEDRLPSSRPISMGSSSTAAVPGTHPG